MLNALKDLKQIVQANDAKDPDCAPCHDSTNEVGQSTQRRCRMKEQQTPL
jgi:hypothetical protein